MKKGEVMACDQCGLAVTVCDPCECTTEELICCGEPMRARPKRRTASASRASKRTKKTR